MTCKDCRHRQQERCMSPYVYMLATANNLPRPSYVQARQDETLCGKMAWWWEPKPGATMPKTEVQHK